MLALVQQCAGFGMALTGSRTYVGFGFGAIQAGLFLYEAFQSGAFGRLVVAEIVPDLVAALRGTGGYFSVNVALANGVDRACVGPVQIEDPAVDIDRQHLIDAVAEAEEIGIAVPSVKAYVSDAAGSLHRVLAQGLRRKVTEHGPRAVIYAAENHNHAAEILQASVMAEIPESERDQVAGRVRFLNTVIGKMSGVIRDPAEIQAQNLAPLTPDIQWSFLVEQFNRILISKVDFEQREDEPPFRRGFEVFEEKADLLPFEEAKLFGHNATHALAAYLGMLKGIQLMAGLKALPDFMPFLRVAFIEESGIPLIRKYGGVDPLFTEIGYARYVDDLLERMTNPFLRDTVERTGRDPARKLGWNDRLIGTLRLALQFGVTPHRYAMGAAAALAVMDRAALDERVDLASRLDVLWQASEPAPQERVAVLELVEEGRRDLQRWLQR